MPIHVARELLIEQIPEGCIEDCSHAGNCDQDVAYWRERLGFTVDRARAIACLEDYGAWTPEELRQQTDEELADIILWCACGTFSEWDGTADSPCGSDSFILE